MIMQQQLADNFHKYYGLEITNVKVINRLMFRQSFLVDASDGNQYIVKEYAATLSLQDLSKTWQYYLLLRNFGITVGCPLRNRFSDEFHMCINNRNYVVFEYIKGGHPDIHQSNEIANCLKKYHKAAETIQIPGLISTEEKLRSAKNYFSYFEQGSYSIKEKILLCKPHLYRIVDEYTNCGQIIIHGDSILENMIKNNKEVCLIDFDSIRYGDNMEDVANTILSIMYYGSEQYEIQPERLKQVKMFIDCYYGNEHSKDVEKKLYYYMQVHCVIELIRHAENIRFLIRMPGMKNYLSMLIHVICSKSLNTLNVEGELIC